MVARMSNLARKMTTSLAAAKKNWRRLGLIFSLIVACRVMCQEDKPLVHRFRPGDTVTFSCNGLQVGVPPTAHVREMYVLKEGYGVVYRYNKYDPLKRVPSPDHWNFRAEGAEKADANSGSFNIIVEISDMRKADRGLYSCMASYDDVGGSGSVKRIQKKVAVLVFAASPPPPPHVDKRNIGGVIFPFLVFTIVTAAMVLSLMSLPQKYFCLADDKGSGSESSVTVEAPQEPGDATTDIGKADTTDIGKAAITDFGKAATKDISKAATTDIGEGMFVNRQGQPYKTYYQYFTEEDLDSLSFISASSATEKRYSGSGTTYTTTVTASDRYSGSSATDDI